MDVNEKRLCFCRERFEVESAILASGDIVSLGGGVYRPPDAAALESGLIRVFALIALIAMTSLITRTMQETRHMLRSRSDELAEQIRRDCDAARDFFRAPGTP